MDLQLEQSLEHYHFRYRGGPGDRRNYFAGFVTKSITKARGLNLALKEGCAWLHTRPGFPSGDG